MRLFVDTSAWFALVDRSDQNHRAAAGFVKQFRVEPVIWHLTDYIVDETATLLRLKLSHCEAVAFLDFLDRSRQVVRSQVTPDLLREAEAIFRRYSDKKWSFTDCVSFAYMDAQGLADVFAFDRNFTEYGKQPHPS